MGLGIPARRREKIEAFAMWKWYDGRASRSVEGVRFAVWKVAFLHLVLRACAISCGLAFLLNLEDRWTQTGETGRSLSRQQCKPPSAKDEHRTPCDPAVRSISNLVC